MNKYDFYVLAISTLSLIAYFWIKKVIKSKNMEDKALIKNWWKYGPLVGGVGISILAIYSGEKLYFILSAYLIGMFVYNIFKKMKSNP